MSASLKLSSKLPGDEEINGLDSCVDMLFDPDTVLCALVWFVPTKITKNLADDTEIPTVEVRRVEPIGDVTVVPQHIQHYAAELYERRTGKNPLPFAELIAPRGDVDTVPDIEDGLPL